MTNPLLQLRDLGQSVWYDFITRDLISSGELARLIREDGLAGMTSNPTIFEKAVAGSAHYDDDILRHTEAGERAPAIFEAMAVSDVRSACDVFRPVADRSANGDGAVSIEVSPGVARDTEASIVEARRLWRSVGRPNVMVKIPGTAEGLGAIARCTEEGISINITLLFSVERYREVIDAWFTGLERRIAAAQPVAGIRSVASFFVSRVDTKVDALLDRKGPSPLRGRAAIANACKAYQLFEESLATPRWKALEARGVAPQRPLWASTSTKDPRYPDTYYVEALIAPQTVNTVPPETFRAYRDHGKPVDRIHDGIAGADRELAALAAVGVDLGQVTRELEDEGIEKFEASYRSLLSGIESKAGALAARA